MRAVMTGLMLAAVVAAPAAAAAAAALAATTTAPRLERVVFLMRHGIRPPTKAQPVPARYSPDPWPAWPVNPGLLTPNGAKGVALLGAADRGVLVAAGVLPATGCAPGTLAVHASGKPRAIRTAEAWAAAVVPGCTVAVEHPAEDGPDPIFHGLDDQPASFDGTRALAEAQALAPAGGIAAEAAALKGEIVLLERVLGCAAPACDLEALPTALKGFPHDRPELEGPIDIGSTASQSLLLEYLEGKPMAQVGWGRVTRAEIERLLAFHPVKFRYSNRPATVARTAAAPLARAILAGLTAGPAVTLLAGHDTNLADMAALLDLHWQVPSYPADDIPPGGAIVFERWRGAGGAYVRAVFRAQSMDQLRGLVPLTGPERPPTHVLDIPGCGTAKRPQDCTLAKFTALVRGKIGR